MFRNSPYEGIFHNLLANIDARNKKQAKINLGITEIDSLEGCEPLNIPHKYSDITIVNGYLHCSLSYKFITENKGSTDVFTNTGEFLFNASYFHYKEQGMFLVGQIGESLNDVLYSLYNQGIKLTDYVFKDRMGKFNEQGFCCLSTNDWGVNVIVNKEGKTVYQTDSYDSPYIYGVICSTKDAYLNLVTGERICSKGYSSTLSTKDHKFIQLGSNSVYQINVNTGEYIVHGEAEVYVEPKPKETNVIKILPIATPPSPKVQGRNDLCECQSGKKFKNCCLK